MLFQACGLLQMVLFQPERDLCLNSLISVLSTQFKHFSESAGTTWMPTDMTWFSLQSFSQISSPCSKGLNAWQTEFAVRKYHSHWWIGALVMMSLSILIIQYSSFTLQILKWLDTAVQGEGGTGGSSTWVTILGNITFYSSCGMGGPNFKIKIWKFRLDSIIVHIITPVHPLPICIAATFMLDAWTTLILV